MEPNETLFGRRLPLTEPPAGVLGVKALVPQGNGWQCLRCGQTVTATTRLPNGAGYCRTCLNLGRLTSQTKLYTIPEPNQFSPVENPLVWPGQLSGAQKAAAQRVQQLTTQRKDQLLWAVTGAGKTEMVYPALAWALRQGWRVAWTSPRVDVCLELAPRLARDFAVTPAVLYGGQVQPYAYRQLTICTTHQLLRFYAAFDWIVVDEVDAFPLATSPFLRRAIQTAQKPTGSHLLLTATPGLTVQRQVKRGRLAVTYLPLRYHGYLLPELRLHLIGRWRDLLGHGRLPGAILQRLRRYQRTQKQCLVFVPHVADLLRVQLALLAQTGIQATTVFAADPKRQAKVQQFRDLGMSVLITTTILERGVTFSDVQVIILGGDEGIFSTAALVQIAGRVGRLADHPRGEATCYGYSQTLAIWRAQHMIKQLNRRAKRLGGHR